MTPELLFLRRVEEADRLSQSVDQFDLLDLARVLHMLICDKHALADTVNTGGKGGQRLPLTFSVIPPEDPPAFVYAGGAAAWAGSSIDPEFMAGLPGAAGTIEAGKDALLATTVLWAEGARISILQLIKFLRSAEGGGHYDPGKLQGEWMHLRNVGDPFLGKLLGQDPNLGQLRPIGRIITRGLVPLYNDVLNRRGEWG